MKTQVISFNGQAVVIYCTDQKRSELFYEGVLGAHRLPAESSLPSWFQLGRLTLNLCPNAAEPSPARFPDHSMPALWLQVDDLAAARQHLIQHNVVILEFHEDQFMIIQDPDGLLLEIWQTYPDAGSILSEL